uniref:DUF4218 domain-containing protein n=1 Tax=Fagus sylvatica TaxID=28930 RepID=A0A2N9FKN1_FAGSY
MRTRNDEGGGWSSTLYTGPRRIPSQKTVCGNNQLRPRLIEKMKQKRKRPRGLPWPPRSASLKGNNHRSPALRWSLLVLIMELRKHGLERPTSQPLLLYALTSQPLPSLRSPLVDCLSLEASKSNRVSQLGLLARSLPARDSRLAVDSLCARLRTLLLKLDKLQYSAVAVTCIVRRADLSVICTKPKQKRLALPNGHLVPNSLYSAKKVIHDLGLEYEKIDACVNDCVLYHNEYADLEQCPICMESRWKSVHNNVVNESDETTIGEEKKNKKVPNKILRYFPLTPRLQRNKISFDNTRESREAPKPLTGDEVIEEFEKFEQVKECKVSGLKTHDCHVIFQRLLSLVIRSLLPKKVCEPLIGLSGFFAELCSKELRVEELDRLNDQIAETICKLEQVFPPSFFDVMMHLPIHLAYDAKVAGPVQYRGDMEGLRIDVNVVEGVNLEDDNVFENSDTDEEDDMSIDDEFVGACLDNDEDDDEFLCLYFGWHHHLSDVHEMYPLCPLAHCHFNDKGCHHGQAWFHPKYNLTHHHLNHQGNHPHYNLHAHFPHMLVVQGPSHQEQWRLVDDDYAQTKILRIPQERPEELDPEEWEGMIKYFKTDDFQDEAKKRIAEIEVEECRPLSAEEQDEIYQSIVGSKPNYVHGRGYMAKPPTFAECVHDEVNCEIQTLKKKLEEERAEREAEHVVERAKREAERAAERVKRKEERAADRAESDGRLEAFREEFMAIFANQSQVYKLVKFMQMSCLMVCL